MMKKLLVLVLIFAMAPLASAATVTLSYTGTTPAGGSINMDVAGATYDPYLALVSDPGVLSALAAGAQAPSVTGSFGAVTVSGQDGEVWGFGTAAGEAYQDGSWLTANWVSATGVWVRAYETMDFGATWQLMDEIFIPEPMTVALLGLGGLFLLRRRK
jgi:hypothetical protein